jgi:hypothetical protein
LTEQRAAPPANHLRFVYRPAADGQTEGVVELKVHTRKIGYLNRNPADFPQNRIAAKISASAI